MGNGLSEEEGGQDRVPYNTRYLHWLLSDGGRVQEAFKPVWRACSSDEHGTCPKATVLEVMLRVVAEFERSASTNNGIIDGKTSRQLARVVGMLQDPLTRNEALHLFKTALLSVQASLVMKNGELGEVDYPQNHSFSLPTTSEPLTPGGMDSGFQTPSGPSKLPFSVSFASSYSPSAASMSHGGHAIPSAPSAGTEPSIGSSRASTRAEDITPQSRARGHFMVLPSSLSASAGVLPSRHELEVENEQLMNLAEKFEASAADELGMVRVLEEEVKASEASEGSASGSNRPTFRAARSTRSERSADSALYAALEAKAEATEEEVTRLEHKVCMREREVSECESEASIQQQEVQTLLAERSEEETSADELGKEARDLALELKSCRRTCGSLESEIASEEARATALREAFEGRRARFTTAETAARNAELSTMRATRRRIAAEAAARHEAGAVEEARNARSFASANAAAKMEALTSEIAEVRSRGARAQQALGSASVAASRRASATAQATASAETALRGLRAELAQEERERDREVEIAHSSANEVAELEVARARLEGQLAGREGELRAAQRRALRAESSSASISSMANADDEVEYERVTQALQAVESRVIRIRHHEAELHGELSAARRRAPASADPMTLAQEEQATEEAWCHAREVGEELGEARAALVRRRAQEKSGGGPGVVEALRVALQAAERREAEMAAEVLEVRSKTAAPSRGLEPLEAQVASLEEQFRDRSRALDSAEVRVQALELAQEAAGRRSGLASAARRAALRERIVVLEQEVTAQKNSLSRGNMPGDLRSAFQHGLDTGVNFGADQTRASRTSPTRGRTSQSPLRGLGSNGRVLKNDMQVESLRRQVQSLEQELDHKEDVILKLDNLASQRANAVGTGLSTTLSTVGGTLSSGRSLQAGALVPKAWMDRR